MPFSDLNLLFGIVILKIRAEFRYFSPFPWKRSMYNSLFTKSLTLFDCTVKPALGLKPNFET